MNIVVLDGFTLNPGDLSWQDLSTCGQVDIFDRTPPEMLNDRLKNAQIVLTNKTLLMEETLRANPQIKYIGVLATGYNVVDTTTAKEMGIVVCNVPGYSTHSVAQLTMSLLLALCHHPESHSNAVYQGTWTKSPDFCFWQGQLVELQGKTMGLIGFGSIAKKVALLAQAFGMKVIVNYHRAIDHTMSEEIEGVTFVSIDHLLEHADVVSLHVPLTPTTQHMINAQTLAKMKPHAFLINTARGPLIDEEALYEALKNKTIAGAAVDVVSVEPILANNPLLKAPNCIITPHIAWAPLEARQRLMAVTIDNIRQFLKGEPINQVNL